MSVNVALNHSDYLSVYLSFLLPHGRFSSSINPYFALPRFPPPDSFLSPITPYLLLLPLPPFQPLCFHPSLPIPSLPTIPSPPSINPSPISLSLTFPLLHHLYFHPSLPFLLSTPFHPRPTINSDLLVPYLSLHSTLSRSNHLQPIILTLHSDIYLPPAASTLSSIPAYLFPSVFIPSSISNSSLPSIHLFHHSSA